MQTSKWIPVARGRKRGQLLVVVGDRICSRGDSRIIRGRKWKICKVKFSGREVRSVVVVR